MAKQPQPRENYVTIYGKACSPVLSVELAEVICPACLKFRHIGRKSGVAHWAIIFQLPQGIHCHTLGHTYQEDRTKFKKCLVRPKPPSGSAVQTKTTAVPGLAHIPLTFTVQSVPVLLPPRIRHLDPTTFPDRKICSIIVAAQGASSRIRQHPRAMHRSSQPPLPSLLRDTCLPYHATLLRCRTGTTTRCTGK